VKWAFEKLMGEECELTVGKSTLGSGYDFFSSMEVRRCEVAVLSFLLWK